MPVIPAKAGIQRLKAKAKLVSRFRGNDELWGGKRVLRIGSMRADVRLLSRAA